MSAKFTTTTTKFIDDALSEMMQDEALAAKVDEAVKVRCEQYQAKLTAFVTQKQQHEANPVPDMRDKIEVQQKWLETEEALQAESVDAAVSWHLLKCMQAGVNVAPAPGGAAAAKTPNLTPGGEDTEPDSEDETGAAPGNTGSPGANGQGVSSAFAPLQPPPAMDSRPAAGNGGGDSVVGKKRKEKDPGPEECPYIQAIAFNKKRLSEQN